MGGLKGSGNVFMKSCRNITMFLAVLAQGAGGGEVLANTIFAGNVKLVEGVNESEYVKIMRPGLRGPRPAKPGDALFEGDTVKTGNGVKTLIELTDHTIITIAPNSSLQIAGYLLDRPASRRNTVMKVLKGTLRFVVAKAFKVNGSGLETAWKDSAVTIEAMNAVAGVRGTDLFMIQEGDATEVAVLEGVVAVHSGRPGGNGQVLLGANQLSRIPLGKKPGAAEALSPERRDTLMQSTVLQQAMSNLDEALGKKLSAKKKYDKDAIMRDLAAGKPLADVIDKAVEAGMPLDEVIAATMDAGANPAIIVYTCVQEGYTPSLVVEAAITCGVPVQTVFTAANSAGADQQSLIAGAQGAGIPPSDIAGALTDATVSPLQTLSTLPSGGDTLSVLPPAPLPIGASGGGTPSASPYKP